METFTQLTSTLAPLPMQDIDTDQIIPARYLKVTNREGLAKGLFSNWSDDPEFVLNLEQYRGAKILLAGDNFGCGSSREHAPWALLDYGFRAVISTRFADIFLGNSLENGLLPVTVDAGVWQRLLQACQQDPTVQITIDLEDSSLLLPPANSQSPAQSIQFAVDPLARQCMLRGTDQLGYLLEQLPEIAAWEAQRSAPVDTLRPTRTLAPENQP